MYRWYLRICVLLATEEPLSVFSDPFRLTFPDEEDEDQEIDRLRQGAT